MDDATRLEIMNIRLRAQRIVNRLSDARHGDTSMRLAHEEATAIVLALDSLLRAEKSATKAATVVG